MILTVTDIEQILPHRAPMLLVDRIIELEPYKSAVGIKNISYNEPAFRGHFPGKPVMPGVLILEAMAQVGGIALLYPDENRGKLPVFGGMDNIKFKKQIVPGDQMVMKATITKIHGNFGRLHAEVFVDEKLAVMADFTFALLEEKV